MLRLIFWVLLIGFAYLWFTGDSAARLWAQVKQQGVRPIAEQVWCGQTGCDKNSHPNPTCVLDAKGNTVCTPTSKSR